MSAFRTLPSVLTNAGHSAGASNWRFRVLCGVQLTRSTTPSLDPKTSPSNLTATMTYQPGGEVGSFEMEGLGGKSHVLATADEPTHAVHRKALLPQLAAKRIRAFEPFIAETAEQLKA